MLSSVGALFIFMAIYLFGLNPKDKVIVPIPEDASPQLLKAAEEYELKINSEVPGVVICYPVKTWRAIGGLLTIAIESNLNLSEPTISFSKDQLEELKDSFDMNEGSKVSAETCVLVKELLSELMIFFALIKHDTVYYNLGVWNKLSEFPGVTEEMTTELNSVVPLNGIIYSPIRIDNIEYAPAHSCTLDDLEVFANFIENCNGFLIQ